MIEKTIYECEYCHQQYKTLPQVEACEKKCLHFEREKEIGKILPRFHKNDTRYLLHCVDCGKKLQEFERSFDGTETECGKVIFEAERSKAFGGLRCPDCHTKLRDIVYDVLVERRKKNVRS